MVINFFTPSFSPYRGGVEKHLFYVTNELVKDGHIINIFVLRPGKNYSSDGINVYFCKRYINSLQYRFAILYLLLSNFNNLRTGDKFHFQDQVAFDYFSPFLRLFNCILRKPLFITYHGWEGQFPPDRKIVCRRRRSNQIVKGSLGIGSYIQKWYGTPLNFISYGGVELHSRNSNTIENRIIFIGRLASDTGVIAYIKAFIRFNNIYRNKFELFVYGDGVLKDEVLDFTSNHDFIHYMGFVDNINAEISTARIVLTAGYLGILESFAQAKNVISIYEHELKEDYLKGFPEFDKLFWVVRDSCDDIIEALEESLTVNKGLRAQEFARINSWQEMKETHYKLYKL